MCAQAFGLPTNSAEEANIFHDDDFAAHANVNGINISEDGLFRLGNCDCNEGGCGNVGGTPARRLTTAFQDTGDARVDIVSISAEALEKKRPHGGFSDVGFSNLEVTANWRLCHEGESTENGRCVPDEKTAELSLSQNVFGLSPNNQTGTGWVLNEGDSGSGFDVECLEDLSAPWAELNCPTETVYTSAGFGVTVNSPEEPGTHEARMAVRVSRLAPGTTAVGNETETILVRYTVPEPIEPVVICADCGSARLACSVSASPATIRPGESVRWSVQSNLGSQQGGHAFSWTGSDNGRDIGIVSGGRTNLSASYPISQPGTYERGIVVEASPPFSPIR